MSSASTHENEDDDDDRPDGSEGGVPPSSASTATREGNSSEETAERRAIAVAMEVAERALASRTNYLNGRSTFPTGVRSNYPMAEDSDEHDESDEDDSDSNDDQLTQEYDHDPFNVDQKKMLHFPGAVISRGRNIAQILVDRSMFGSKFKRLLDLTTTDEESENNHDDDDNIHAAESQESDASESSSKTERATSPNAFAATTVPAGFHSPHPTQSNSTYLSPTPQPHYGGYRSPPHPSSNLSSASTQSPKLHLGANNYSAITKNTNSLHPVPESITTEIRAFAEYSAAIRFRASYLCHLNGSPPTPILPPRPSTLGSYARGNGPIRGRIYNEPQPNNSNNNMNHVEEHLPAGETLIRRLQRQQREMQQNMHQQHHVGQRHRLIHPRGFAAHPPPNNNNSQNSAVSTISLAFSPDGRTLASTHGDHTVKITCCHTGKLIRQLEGHPRTPWTVKYHPTNSRIVASGCLGYQVRIWDWNFQPEGVRRSRKRDRERKWDGRYACDEGNWNHQESKVDGVGEGVFAGGCSPRGVVEHPMRKQSMDSTDEDVKYAARDVVEHLLPMEEDDDDYAAFVLANLGIPSEDPAWYDCESESFNYDDGLGVCLNMIRLNHAIISLSFHPTGEVLAVASGNTLHLWDYDEEKRKKREAAGKDNDDDGNDQATRFGSPSARPLPASPASRESYPRGQNSNNRERNSNSYPRGRTMDFRHESALRCVHFPPSGDTLIVGGVNPHRYNEGLPGYRSDPRSRGGMSGGGMSFHLRLWDFDLDAVLNSSEDTVIMGGRSATLPRGGRISEDGDISWNFRLPKDAIGNPRTIIPRVLLYNDGGFDISQDGKVLSACAEYWLPDGIDNAMELLLSQQDLDYESSVDEEAKRSGNDSPPIDGSRKDIVMPSPSYGSGLRSNVPDPRTPPPNSNYTSLEPPSPPGKRNIPRYGTTIREASTRYGGMALPPKHNPHPLSVVAASHPSYLTGGGRYVPHIVTVSMDTSPPIDGVVQINNANVHATESMRHHPQLGQLLMAAPLDGTKASGVTCVKLSPSAEYCLLGYGVRESVLSVDGNEEIRHPVTALYNVKKGMKHLCTLLSPDDDVNIARFHPESGHGFVYGTKQGRVRVLATRPWNQYQNMDESTA